MCMCAVRVDDREADEYRGVCKAKTMFADEGEWMSGQSVFNTRENRP